MSKNSSKIFAGESDKEENQKAYAETASLFISTIKERLRPGRYSFLDIGTHEGGLLKKIVSGLEDYEFNLTGLDSVKENLDDNSVVDNKILADAKKIPLDDKSIDVSIMRYVLQWNSLEEQEEILKELKRVTNKFILIEHAGADTEDPEEWRSRADGVYSGAIIKKFERTKRLYSSKDEIEEMLDRHCMKFEVLRHRKIEHISGVLSERFGLDEDETDVVKDIMGDMDYFYQTDWIVFPR